MSQFYKNLRIILINYNKKYKNNKLKLGIITLDLSDIKAENRKQLFKDFLRNFKKYVIVFNKNKTSIFTP